MPIFGLGHQLVHFGYFVLGFMRVIQIFLDYGSKIAKNSF